MGLNENSKVDMNGHSKKDVIRHFKDVSGKASMDMNGKFISDLIIKIMQAMQSGTSMDFETGEEIGQYVWSLFAMGAGLVPVIGGALGAFASLLGSVFFPSNGLTLERIWEGLRKQIEELIDSKIAEYHLNVLKQRVTGLRTNMSNYSRFLKDFRDAPPGPEKDKAATTLHSAHIAFITVVLDALPQFQLDEFAVASLPLFALVANIHLALLADGIKEGKEWGYSDANVAGMGTQFRAKTSTQSSKKPGDEDLSWMKSPLEEAIKSGPEMGVPDDVIETWKEAYSNLFGSGKKPKGSNDGLDYVSYARKIYGEGRKKVQAYNDVSDRGGPEAGRYRAYADYDASMIMSVLNYAELWPYMIGAEIPESVVRNLDREIFFGPSGRYTSGASWDTSNPPRVENRGTPITGLIVRAWDDIDGLQVKKGTSWSSWQGSSTGGTPQQLDLTADEWVKSAEVTYGHKLGKLKFVTNKNRVLQNGNARHATKKKDSAPPGYELTSVTVTNWESSSPPGCEGVILGFRPIMTDATRN